MIRFHFDNDFDTHAYSAAVTPAGDILFIVSSSNLAGVDPWVRETLANEIARMAEKPKTPNNVIYLADLQSYWLRVGAGSESTSIAVATDR